MGNHGIKVSKEGYDVKTATPSQLIYSSKYNLFKIKGIYATTLKVAKGDLSAEATLDNPLDYSPVAFHFFDPNPSLDTPPTAAGNLRPMNSPDAIYWDLVNFDPTYCGAWYTNSNNKFNYRIGLNTGNEFHDYWFYILSVIFIDKFGV